MPRIALGAPLLFIFVGAGCIGVSASKSADSSSAAAQPGQAADAKHVPKGSKLTPCNGKLVPADDGLVDDFEDGDRQLLKVAERDGYWWKHHDDKGAAFIPDEIMITGPGAAGSEKAVHVTGKLGGGDGAYGASLGVNLSSAGTYDGSPYAGIAFKAKADPNTATTVRFKLGDVNTHQDPGVCTSCWNHFGKDITLTQEWGEYQLAFAELAQVPGWGDPRPPSVTPEALYVLDWTVPSGTTFGFWLDDIVFLKCE